MQLTVENGMKAPRHQVHGKRRGEAGGVLHVGGELNAPVTRRLTRLSWKAGQPERDGGHPLEVPQLASFARANRARLAVLTEAAVTAGLREVLTGVKCLASVRPMSPRLAVAPIALVRGQDFGPGLPSPWLEPAHLPDADAGVDEGGIYSW
ncbi:MAG: hypothetical protein ACXU86_08520 [Archangium sp.]